MSEENIPEESMKTIEWIADEYEQSKKNIIDYYWKVFNRPFIAKHDDLDAKHVWTARVLKSEFQDQPPATKKSFIVAGKNALKPFTPPQVPLIVIDAHNKKVKSLVLKEKAMEASLVWNVGDVLEDVMLSGSDESAYFGDQRCLPPAEPKTSKPALTVLKLLKPREVRMADFENKKKLSKTVKGYPVDSDLVVIRKAMIVANRKNTKQYYGKEYENGWIIIKDDSHDGIVLDDGREIPTSMICFANGQYVYGKYSIGDAYLSVGWSKPSKKEDTPRLQGNLAYFDLHEEGEEML